MSDEDVLVRVESFQPEFFDEEGRCYGPWEKGSEHVVPRSVAEVLALKGRVSGVHESFDNPYSKDASESSHTAYDEIVDVIEDSGLSGFVDALEEALAGALHYHRCERCSEDVLMDGNKTVVVDGESYTVRYEVCYGGVLK